MITKTEWTLDEVIDNLARQHQRATYGAVAGMVGRPATFLMSGLPRNHRNSWVVNQETRLPTGYTPEQQDPALEERREVISAPAALAAWLEPPD